MSLKSPFGSTQSVLRRRICMRAAMQFVTQLQLTIVQHVNSAHMPSSARQQGEFATGEQETTSDGL